MFRATLIYLSKAPWARKIVTRWRVAWQIASRFVAGESLDDAIRVVKTLNDRGIHATLDHLGEHTSTPEQARKATEDILEIFDAINASGICANVSIKLTQIGLALDDRLCTENLRKILGYAREVNNWVRVDMEDSPWVDYTLRLIHLMHDEGLTNVGVVIQAYLYRSENDINNLMERGVRVRLCKGAYKEPKEVAYPNKRDVDENFDRLTELLVHGALKHGSPEITSDCRVPPIPAIASHDADRLLFAHEYADKASLPKGAIEYQMLNGIRRDLQEKYAQDGYPVRVYVPYGSEWYPYFMRRLAERPANLWFFISNYFQH